MPLVVPTHRDYTESAQSLKTFFDAHELEYCFYGSILFPEKVRRGLSDIDVIVVSSDSELVFPIGITRAFGVIKQRIGELGIPLQANLVTQGQLRNNLHTADPGYITEVKRGLLGTSHSSRIRTILDEDISERNQKDDDKNMMRYFHRKIQQIGLYIPKIEIIIKKAEDELTSEDQHTLFQFWDAFKKMISYIGAAIRVHSGESVFHLKDKDLINEFTTRFNVDTSQDAEFNKYIEALRSIHSISDWYNFLKNNGIDTIIDIYTSVFSRIFRATSDNIRG